MNAQLWYNIISSISITVRVTFLYWIVSYWMRQCWSVSVKESRASFTHTELHLSWLNLPHCSWTHWDSLIWFKEERQSQCAKLFFLSHFLLKQIFIFGVSCHNALNTHLYIWLGYYISNSFGQSWNQQLLCSCDNLPRPVCVMWSLQSIREVHSSAVFPFCHHSHLHRLLNDTCECRASPHVSGVLYGL